MKIQIPRLLVGGTGSGCGKTTVTCAILQVLKNRKKRVAAFKCGPDYIDPMFHSRVIGMRARNLDGFLCGKEQIPALLAENSRDCDIAVIEGVMGFYDGIGGENSENSSADIACLTQTPSVLVAQCKTMSLTLAAVLKGILTFRSNTIQGVILNGISKEMLPYYKKIVERETNIPVLGCLPSIPEAAIESRHLGLVTADEIDGLSRKVKLLAAEAEECIDMDTLLTIAESAPELSYCEPTIYREFTDITVAVAWDSAFCFTYADSLRMLENLGARLQYFSPIEDEGLPESTDGLLLCGGYPELYAEALSRNTDMRQSICSAVNSGLPTIAECGGFLYLHETLEGYPMAGVIPNHASMTKKLGPFGYVTLKAEEDNLLCAKGETMPAHEFHYSESGDTGESFIAQKPYGHKSWPCIHGSETLFAGYPHIHFRGNTAAARRFLTACQTFGK